MKHTIFVIFISFFSPLIIGMENINRLLLPIKTIMDIKRFEGQLVAYTTFDDETLKHEDAYPLSCNPNINYAYIDLYFIDTPQVARYSPNILLKKNAKIYKEIVISFPKNNQIISNKLAMRFITNEEKEAIAHLINSKKAQFQFPTVQIAKTLGVSTSTLYDCSGLPAPSNDQNL